MKFQSFAQGEGAAGACPFWYTPVDPCEAELRAPRWLQPESARAVSNRKGINRCIGILLIQRGWCAVY